MDTFLALETSAEVYTVKKKSIIVFLLLFSSRTGCMISVQVQTKRQWIAPERGVNSHEFE
jgi:hypothetical protein